MRFAAASVPSQTMTTPACCEYPMPTPPPWWIDTQVAPPAVLSSALRSGQSDTASEPSAMASVSRLGLATEPVSRWSRPITIGAESSPVRTISLNARPARCLSPRPSQQMRAGSPWNAMRSPAMSSQRCRCASSGKSSRTFLSVRRMSSGSPESATQRNGPFPSQNSGRMYAGTNPGNANASVTPSSFATWRMLLP